MQEKSDSAAGGGRKPAAGEPDCGIIWVVARTRKIETADDENQQSREHPTPQLNPRSNGERRYDFGK
jgi:hypothetical protein